MIGVLIGLLCTGRTKAFFEKGDHEEHDPYQHIPSPQVVPADHRDHVRQVDEDEVDPARTTSTSLLKKRSRRHRQRLGRRGRNDEAETSRSLHWKKTNPVEPRPDASQGSSSSLNDGNKSSSSRSNKKSKTKAGHDPKNVARQAHEVAVHQNKKATRTRPKNVLFALDEDVLLSEKMGLNDPFLQKAMKLRLAEYVGPQCSTISVDANDIIRKWLAAVHKKNAGETKKVADLSSSSSATPTSVVISDNNVTNMADGSTPNTKSNENNDSINTDIKEVRFPIDLFTSMVLISFLCFVGTLVVYLHLLSVGDRSF